MEKITGYNIYFCDHGKPQQKPLIDYINCEFKQWFKKGTDFNNITQPEINWVFNIINEKIKAYFKLKNSKRIIFR